MDGETLRLVLITGLGSAAGLWFLLSLFVRVSGEWVELLEDDARREGRRPLKLSLSAFGPLVSGQAEVPGGREEFSGYIVGRTLFLKRRDHGVQHLQNQGYPPEIATRRDGEVAAKLKLKLASRDELRGEFFPFKVNFTHQPPRVTGVVPLPGRPRAYSRLAGASDSVAEEVPLDEPVTAA